VNFSNNAVTKFWEFKESAIWVFTWVKDWAIETMWSMKDAVIEKFNSMLSFIRWALQRAKDTAREIATLGFANTQTFNGSTSGTKANWGAVNAWEWYMVWERGPEKFIPATNWIIVPSNQAWGWNSLSIWNVNLPNVNNARDFIKELENMARLQSIWVT